VASRQEIAAVADALRAIGQKVAVADSANYYANSLESMFAATRGDRGPRQDILLLQCTDHAVADTLCVMKYSQLTELLARVSAADKVLARGA